MAPQLLATRRMRKGLLALGLLAVAGCGVTGYYVADVFSENGRFVMVKCPIEARNGKPNPNQCFFEPVRDVVATVCGRCDTQPDALRCAPP